MKKKNVFRLFLLPKHINITFSCIETENLYGNFDDKNKVILS